jgi:predicted enzyme related to lactoylglutathione lyase
MSGPAFQCVSPVFLTSNLETSLRYYVDVLGFTVGMSSPPAYAIVKRGSVEIHLAGPMLAQDHTAGQGSCYIFCDDVDALHSELTARRALKVLAVEDRPYGMRDFCCSDSDVNKIGFGQLMEARPQP